jgi:glycosyltransferase involved in cell wall biosynthesis
VAGARGFAGRSRTTTNRPMSDSYTPHACPAENPSGNAECHPCLSVVMPAYNEEDSIDRILPLVLAQRPVSEVIVVDDCSRDGTWARLQAWPARDPRVRIFRHDVNRGKGAALRTGLSRAAAEYVIIQDADLEYDPREYYVLLAPLLADRADVVFGSRFAGGSRRVLYFWHALGNRALTTLSNMFTNLWLTDMETCYKVFRREVVQKLVLKEDRFGFEPEITAKVSRLRVRVFEVPISYYGRTYAEGKKIGWKDGFSALRCIVKYSLFE